MFTVEGEDFIVQDTVRVDLFVFFVGLLVVGVPIVYCSQASQLWEKLLLLQLKASP
jgi:hypothetical protein